MSIDEEKKLRALFRYVDKQEKNLLTKEDIRNAIKEVNYDLSEEKFNEIFKLLDADHNEIIEYQEFLRATCNKSALLTEENLKNTFLALSGGEEKEFINGEDIKKFIFHDSNIQEQKFIEYLEQFGMKKDDKINFEQFYDIIKNEKKLNEKNDKEENGVNKKKDIELKMSIIEEKDEYISEK